MIRNFTKHSFYLHSVIPGICLVLSLLLAPVGLMAQDTFRSTGSGGDWNSTSTWEVATSYNPFVWSSASSVPGSSDTVYLAAGTTVSLFGDESVADLHFNNTDDVVRLSTGNNTLDIYGKIRIYGGAEPGTTLSGSAGVQGWINTGASGSLRFVGSSDRYVVEKGEFGARMENANMTVEFAFDPGATAFIDETVRFGNVTVSSGTLRVLDDHTLRPTETDTRTNAADGNLTINAGATVYGGRGIFKNKNNAIGTLQIDAGGRLIFTYPAVELAVQTLNINGSLELLNTYTGNQYFPEESTRFGASQITTASKLVLGGSAIKTLVNTFTVTDTLEYSGTHDSVNFNTFSFGYDGDGGTLVYSKSADHTTGSVEFPGDGTVTGLVLNTSNTVTLDTTKLVDGNITFYNGYLSLGEFDLVMGNSASSGGTPGDNAMVLQNGSGRVVRVFNGPDSFTFPIGTLYDSVADASGVLYSPATVAFTSGSFSNDSVSVVAADAFFSPQENATDSLSRYWEVSIPAALSSAVYDFTGFYVQADVAGDETDLAGYLYQDGTYTPGTIVDDVANSFGVSGQSDSGFYTARGDCGVSDNVITAPGVVSYCPNETIEEITGTVSVVPGSPLYQWELDYNGGGFAEIVGATSQNYTPEVQTSAGTYTYRRAVYTATCASYTYSNTVQITLQSASQCVNEGMVGYWTFDGCDIDEATNEISGLTAPIFEATPFEGFDEQALYFPGTANYVNVGSEEAFDFTNSLSLTAWVNTASPNSRQTIIMKNPVSKTFSWYLDLLNGVVRVGLTGTSAPGPYLSTTNVQDGAWHHIAVTFGDGTLVIYVDGVAERTVNNITGSLNTLAATDVWIGGRNDRTNFYFDGLLDEVRMYNRGLSSAEITSLSGAAQNTVGCGLAGDELVGYWALNDFATTSAALDSVNQSTDAVLLNGIDYETGYEETGLDFDGVNDYAILYDSTWELGISNAFSYGLWVNNGNETTGRETLLFRVTEGFSIMAELFDGVPRMALGGVSPTAYAANTALPANTWHHVMYTYANGTLTIYIDGVQDAQYTGLTGLINFGEGFSWLGAWPNKDRYFEGILDEVRIFNYALTSEEVDTEYNRVSQGGVAPPCTEDQTPVSIWSFDDCLSGVAIDEQSGHDGTFNSATRNTGYENAGVYFGGSNANVNFGFSSDFELPNTFTIAFWANTTQTSNGTFMAKNYNGSTHSYMVIIEGGIPAMTLGSNVNNPGPYSLGVSIADGTWHHVAFRFEDGVMETFLDGVLQTTYNDITGSIAPNVGSDLVLGYRVNKTDWGYVGYMDEVRVYDIAACDSEIADLAALAQSSSDCSGSREAAEPTLEVESEAFTWDVYPNPSEGLFSLRWSEGEAFQEAEILVTNTLGQVVYRYQEARTQGIHEFDLSGQAPGMYFLTVRANGQLRTEKLYLR